MLTIFTVTVYMAVKHPCTGITTLWDYINNLIIIITICTSGRFIDYQAMLHS